MVYTSSLIFHALFMTNTERGRYPCTCLTTDVSGLTHD